MSNSNFWQSQPDDYANEGGLFYVPLEPSMPIEEHFEESEESLSRILGKRHATEDQHTPKRQRQNSVPKYNQDSTIPSHQKAILDFKVTKPLKNTVDFDWAKYKYTPQDTHPSPPDPTQLHTPPLPKPGTHHYVSHFVDLRAPSPVGSLTLCPNSGDAAIEGYYYPQQELVNPISLDTYGLDTEGKLLEEHVDKGWEDCQADNDCDTFPLPKETLANSPKLEENESYSIASSDEEEMARLAEMPLIAEALKIPPSSVIHTMDDNSSIEAFDTSLRRSPPSDATQIGSDPRSNDNQHDEEDLLDYSVDWDLVMGALPSCTRDPSLPSTGIAATAQQTSLAPFTPRIKPFARPRFPTPVRDKSPIAGISKSTVFRTCFRIGELLNEAKKCRTSHQEAIFEVYARVTYSSREGTTRVQHFQFADLFKDQLPYPTGKLSGWKNGSLLDQQSARFLGASRDRAKMCRCICRMKSEKSESNLGRVVVVLGIWEVDWDEVELMRQIICHM
ncbi:hypothetical protein B0H67DRAFT_330920 [Lasiosphaeris hirsuta]|uniref:Uncharacterized protein n=1 Tax=Lasiosphaeris hirsuta TaxID=260670 RepID=A0AA40DPA2_9PEZI|nr:hypothetical protein B0H67DRAFT_330920 [Lasiosphaeris hirsuta]